MVYSRVTVQCIPNYLNNIISQFNKIIQKSELAMDKQLLLRLDKVLTEVLITVDTTVL